MAMRNFYLKGYVDGRKSVITGGPRTKDGAMELKVLVKYEGYSLPALSIVCHPTGDQNVITVIDNQTDTIVYKESFTREAKHHENQR